MKSNNTVTGLHPARAPRAPSPPYTDAVHRASTDELRDALQDVTASVEFLLRQGRSLLARQVAERPQVLLVCAAGLGFVLGGGLASRTGALLVRTGGRLVLAHTLQRWWEGGALTSQSTAATGSSL